VELYAVQVLADGCAFFKELFAQAVAEYGPDQSELAGKDVMSQVAAMVDSRPDGFCAYSSAAIAAASVEGLLNPAMKV
jgi:hypothetical protein